MVCLGFQCFAVGCCLSLLSDPSLGILFMLGEQSLINVICCCVVGI